ncbi:MAG: virulence RhuM family protein, partial [Lachnospiraceae bacterium]|nr:virulence RhuM family protein [Lachnospiraceae bacterium]
MEKNNEIVIFETEDRSVSLPVMLEQDTVWLNRNQISELFERDVKTIGKHINNALREELSEDTSVVAKFATTAVDGKTYQVEHYNLDVILSVGYRVKSRRGVEFRRWANAVLKQYILKGYAVNHNRMKQLGEVIRLM